MANLFFLSGQCYTDATYSASDMNAALLYTYETGSTTNKTTYSDGTQSSANTNPVVASAAGVFGNIYGGNGRYKFVLKTAGGVTVRTWDPWDSAIGYFTATSAPSDTYPGLEYYNSTDGHRYRRNSGDTDWNDLGPVDTAVNAAATVTEQLAGTSTTKASTPDSVAALWQRGTDITTSGGTMSLPSTGGGVFNLTGALSAISSAQGGRTILVKAVGAVTWTHNATSLILPGAANITTVAGDVAIFVNEAAGDASGTNWRCWLYLRAAHAPLTIATQAEAEAATSLTAAMTAGRTQYHPGVAKFWVKATANSTTIEVSHNMTSWADTATGRATGTIATDMSSVDWCIQATVEHDGSANLQGAALANGTQAADTFEVSCRNQGGGLSEPTTWHVVGYGDQA